MHNFNLIMYMGLLLVIDIFCYKTALEQWGPYSVLLLIFAFITSVVIVLFGFVVSSHAEETDESFIKFVKDLKVK